MIEYFFGGVGLFLLLFIFRLTFVLVLSKIYKENFWDNFEFDLKSNFLEAIFFGLLFSFFFWLAESLKEGSAWETAMGILFISLVPTYIFIIKPIQFIFNSNEYSNFEGEKEVLKNPILKEYRIKIINKNVINAYATGVIPFSKTILIGKPLVDSLNQKELISIILHEAGHLKMNHLYKIYLVNLVISTVSYFIFHLRGKYFNFNNYLLDLVAVGMTGCLIGVLIWYIPGKLQYNLEFKADSFASKWNGKNNLQAALRNLDKLSDGEVSTGGITHPTLTKRLKNIQAE